MYVDVDVGGHMDADMDVDVEIGVRCGCLCLMSVLMKKLWVVDMRWDVDVSGEDGDGKEQRR